MTEKNFLKYIFIESCLMILLGLGILIIPKLTDITFGITVCSGLILYGGYKATMAVLSRNFLKHYIFNLINSLIILICGLLLLFVPTIEMTIFATVIGIYFILESIANNAFTFQIRKIFIHLWKLGYIISSMEFLFGIILILFLPSLWFGGILFALDILTTGIILMNLYFAKEYII